MDSSSGWVINHGYGANSRSAGNSGFMCGYASGCVESAAGLQSREEEEQEQLVSSQMQHHLNQIRMHMMMNAEDEPVYGGNGAAVDMRDCLDIVDVDFFPSHDGGARSFPSSSTSSSFPSASLSGSPDSSGHLLTAPAAGRADCLRYPEFSSHGPLAEPVVLPYVDDVNFDDLSAAMAAPEMSTSAFRRYNRHLAPRRRPKPGGAACGQRMFKTAMSVLSKMHSAMRYRHQYSYQQPPAEVAETPSTGNQLQHMISERKRREKLNDSFHALKAVLPPGAKKDKTTILITAREYVNSLKSKLRELEERNQALESRLARRGGAGADDEEDVDAEPEPEPEDKVEIEITRAAAAAEEEEEEPRETCTVRIAARPSCGNTTDVVLRTLQYLKDHVGHDVSLVAMSTTDGGVDPAEDSAAPRRPSLTLQLKSASGAKWEEAAVKEAVARAVADVAPPSTQSAETTASRRGGAGRRPRP